MILAQAFSLAVVMVLTALWKSHGTDAKPRFSFFIITLHFCSNCLITSQCIVQCAVVCSVALCTVQRHTPTHTLAGAGAAPAASGHTDFHSMQAAAVPSFQE
jgi:hypothetical protein